TVVWLGVGLEMVLELFFSGFTTGILVLIIGVSVFTKVRDFFYHKANQYFFSSLYDVREVIEEASEKLALALEPEKLYNSICDVLQKPFQVSAIGVLIFDEKKKKYEVKINRGFNIGNKKYFKGSLNLKKKYTSKGELLIIEELIDKTRGESKKLIQMLDELGVKVVAPLNVEGDTIGLIVLGKKESGDNFNTDDFTVLNVIGQQAAISVKNSMLYEETLEFNKKLQEGIKQATKKLQKANIKLKKLDATKTEFLSIASHQLRTPLTSIKGFSSLLLNNGYGKLNDKQRKTIEKIFISNERLITLVEDLLNISRMEQGRLEYEFEKLNIKELLKEIVGVLSIQASHKDLYLKFKDEIKEQKEVLIKADKKKLTEVISNLIDNAVKYTQQGGIIVKLSRKNKNTILIEVIDTGIGIDPKEKDKIFEKFGRGDDIEAMHSGGAGLGLFIVKKLTEAHGGKVFVESEGKGKGTTFGLELPVASS
ncbi:MAG: hypothetical protein GF335_01550, partial [Candidatus Moranbacteria bacterium]|nr:hypothetical protein [Candidatus Moranbacteria bacterium]